MSDLREKWIEALRGGQYNQGKEALRNGDRFCCLGVLCDIKNTEMWVEYDNDDYNWKVFEDFPPKWLLDEVGLSKDDAVFLATLNDRGSSFSEIADLIEEMKEE
jgi:hypothetical protein